MDWEDEASKEEQIPWREELAAQHLARRQELVKEEAESVERQFAHMELNHPGWLERQQKAFAGIEEE